MVVPTAKRADASMVEQFLAAFRLAYRTVHLPYTTAL
jgi:hypothetical protein